MSLERSYENTLHNFQHYLTEVGMEPEHAEEASHRVRQFHQQKLLEEFGQIPSLALAGTPKRYLVGESKPFILVQVQDTEWLNGHAVDFGRVLSENLNQPLQPDLRFGIEWVQGNLLPFRTSGIDGKQYLFLGILHNQSTSIG
jgi:hypothetical protein